MGMRKNQFVFATNYSTRIQTNICKICTFWKKNISGAQHQSMTKSGNVLFFQKMVDFFQRPKNELMIVSLFDCLTPGLKQWAINYGTIKALDCISIETHGQAQTLLLCHHVTEKFSSRKFQFFFKEKWRNGTIGT